MGELSPGELHVWRRLSELDPVKVCSRAKVTFDEKAFVYTLRSFDCELGIAVNDRKIYERLVDSGSSLLNKVDPALSLSALWYLISAKDIPEANRLIRPASLPGGQIFVKGSHVLPLHRVADKYRNDPLSFISRGEKYGGEKLNYGDASIKLFPYPRVPIVLILRIGDEEFPDNVDILLDKTCVLQLPLDIIWSICLMSVMVML